MPPKPLLILSDAPTSGTGLGRITKDLATRIAEHMPDVFRVATAGYGGVVSRHLPFHQYILEDHKDFVCITLPEIWEDFAGNEKGILLTIWDLQRLPWLAHPETQCENLRLREFLMEKPFEKWIYAPIDSEGTGPNGGLTYPLKMALSEFDRVLAYGKFGAGVIDRTLDLPEGTTQYLPHGIDKSVFYERNRALCRKMFISITSACHLMGNLGERVKTDETLVGILATNQSRKDWALGIEAFARLAKTRNARLWIKTDVLERAWSIPALLMDYDVVNKTVISLGDMTDDQLAQAYSACDVTIAPGAEGWGFPIAESLACGTPCTHMRYAGGAELVPERMRVGPIAFRYEGVYGQKRPVHEPDYWALNAGYWTDFRVELDPQYFWGNLWSRWEKWLKEGVK